MRPAFYHKRILAPSGWNELSQGEWIASQIDERLAAWWPRIFGYHMVKIGSLSRELDTSRCSIRHKVAVASEPGADVLADVARLPFQEASVDACLMAMSLNFHHNPHQLLREVNRITVAIFAPFGIIAQQIFQSRRSILKETIGKFQEVF